MGKASGPDLRFRPRLLALLTLLWWVPLATADTGVVVENVKPGSPGEKVGLQPGDVLLSWSCPAAPPAFPEPSQGSIQSPYDLLPLDIEESLRRGVTLRGKRGDRELAWTLAATEWGIETRPGLPPALTTLYFEGKSNIEAGDLKAAERIWRSAVASAREVGEGRTATWLLHRLAAELAKAGMWTGADAAYGEVVAALERDSDFPAAAQLLRDWGRSFQKRGAWDSSIERLQKALEMDRRTAPRSLAVARTLDAMGVTVARRGDYPAADELLRQALAIREELAPGSSEVAWSLNNLGILTRHRGDLVKAEEYLTRGEALHRQLVPESADRALFLQNLGNLAWSRGDLKKAASLHRQALAIFEKADPGSEKVVSCLINLSSLLILRGDLSSAENLLRRALSLQEQRAPDAMAASESLAQLGNLALRRGDLEAAETHFHRALTIQEKLSPEAPETAATLNNLGLVAGRQGDFARARAYFQRSRTIKEKLGSSDAAILANLGRLEIDSGDLATAEKLLREALAIYQKSAAESLDASEILSDLGEVAFRRGRLAESLALHRRTWEIRHKLAPETTGEAAALYHLGRAEIRSGQRTEGIRNLCLAIDTLDRQRGRIGGTQQARASFEATLGDYYQACLQGLIELGRPAEAFHALERGRARSFLALLAERDLSPSATLEVPTPLDLQGARAVLDSGTVLLAYGVGAETTWLFILQPADVAGPGFSALPIAIDAKGLHAEVEGFRRLLNRSDSERAEIEARARRLYDLLIRPAEAQIAQAQRILVSPAGPLHTLPFAALLRDDRWLIDWKPIHSVLSATVYAELVQSRPARGAPGGERLIAFGDPLYPRSAPESGSDPGIREAVRRGWALDALPSSRREVEAITSLYPEAEAYLGREATEERAKSLGQGSRLIHFACHGLLDERFPLNSALALTIPERPGDSQENGLLQAWEIFESVRLQADLVTLSACDSGLGKEMGGEGLVGLVRAFQFAGARSVLASLWSVADDSTAILMKHFYTHLRQGRTKDEALRAAQLDLIRSGQREISHPYHWAGFALYGDWR